MTRNLVDTAFPYLQGKKKEKQQKREIQPSVMDVSDKSTAWIIQAGSDTDLMCL